MPRNYHNGVAERIRKENLLAHLQNLVGDRNSFIHPRRLRTAAEYITRQFKAYGYQVHADSVRLLWRLYPNIIAEAPVGNPNVPLLIIGAHYDTVMHSPGADDNASGVAAMLEVARVLSAKLLAENPSRLRIQFVGFALEEQSMAGSAHYARMLSRQRVALEGMVSLEMVGYTSDAPDSQQFPPGLDHLYPHVGNFIGVVANERSRTLLNTVVSAMKTVEGLPVESLAVPQNGEALPPTRLSDHSPFWDRGYSAPMITDTSWFRNPHYHQSTDTIETLNLDFMTRVAEGVARSVEAMTK
jgi:aminopeptidase YwaD